MLKKVTGIVLRGYITRMYKEEEWEDELYELPDGRTLGDADAIPHYVINSDGKFVEYYGYNYPDNCKLYCPVEILDESIFE